MFQLFSLKVEGNQFCADCHEENPDWASYTIGGNCEIYKLYVSSALFTFLKYICAPIVHRSIERLASISAESNHSS